MTSLKQQRVLCNCGLLTILALITAVFSILSTVLIIRISIIGTMDRNEQRSRWFVENVIDSINQNTDYYKHNCSKDALKTMEENMVEITANYKTTLIDSEWAFYEYDVTFNGKNKFYISVMRLSRGEFEIVHFKPILPQ